MAQDDEAIKELGRLFTTKGIPPFLVAANITEANYLSVRLWKENGCIVVESVCEDDDTHQPLMFTYRYDKDTTLQRIEMTVADNTGLVWDRQQEIAKLAAVVSSRRERSRLTIFRPVPSL